MPWGCFQKIISSMWAQVSQTWEIKPGPRSRRPRRSKNRRFKNDWTFLKERLCLSLRCRVRNHVQINLHLSFWLHGPHKADIYRFLQCYRTFHQRTSYFPRERPLQYLQCSVHERSKSAELALVVHASARPHIVEIWNCFDLTRVQRQIDYLAVRCSEHNETIRNAHRQSATSVFRGQTFPDVLVWTFVPGARQGLPTTTWCDQSVLLVWDRWRIWGCYSAIQNWCHD